MNRPKLEILAYEETSLGPLCLRRRELLSRAGTVVTEITLNHEFLMSSLNTDSERAISNLSVELHGGRHLKALVGGLGLGYTARELAKHEQVASVKVVEFLAPVIEWLREGLIPLATKLNEDSKIEVEEGDIYQRLLGAPTERFDLIVIDVDHSPEDQLDENDAGFYTATGLAQAKKHLLPGGVLSVWSYAEDNRFFRALEATFKRVHAEPIRTVNELVDAEQTDWLFLAFS